MSHASLPTVAFKVTIELPTLWQTNVAMESGNLQSFAVHLPIQKADFP